MKEGKQVKGGLNETLKTERPTPPVGQNNKVYNEKIFPQGDRFNTGKPQLSLNDLGLEIQELEARVWEYGLVKYGRGNWLKGMQYTKCADSLKRHLTAFLNGEDNDNKLDPQGNSGTGLPHVAHIICCAKILAHAFATRKDLDDRETKPEMPKEEISKFLYPREDYPQGLVSDSRPLGSTDEETGD